jgi:DNA modification methylase
VTAAVIRADAAHLPLPDGSVDLIVTSPPYFGLRSYTDGGEHYDGQLGSEATPREYIAALAACTREWVRVLKPSGSIFVNLGDKYSTGASGQNGLGKSSLGAAKGAGSREAAMHYAERMSGTSASRPVAGFAPKSLLGLPWRYALACTDDLGLILRRDIIWSKPNGLPESVTDRCRSSHEYVFHLVKQPRYYAAVDEIREAYAPGTAERYRSGYGPNRRAVAGDMRGSAGTIFNGELFDANPLGKLPGSVWDIPSQPLTVPPGLGVDHFAAFPMELPRRIILGWSPPGICTECGEGRRPVVSATRIGAGRMWDASGRGVVDRLPRTHDEHTDRQHLGYACGCPKPDAPTRPAVVLDPFGGTGTAALVADMLGRTGISVDRSADYCRLARWRTTDPGERAKALQVPKPPAQLDGQDSLFDLEAV